MNLEDFDSIIAGTYKGDEDFYYKLVTLDLLREDNEMNRVRNELFSKITKIDDDEYKYILFAQTKEFSDLEKINLDEFEGGHLIAMSPLSKYPGTILHKESPGSFVKIPGTNFLKLPEVVFLRAGRIYVHQGLLNLPEYMVRIPEMMGDVGELFNRENSLNFSVYN